MEDKEAHKIIRDMLDTKVQAAQSETTRLREEEKEFESDPDPLTGHIIERTKAKIERFNREAEALAIAASKF